MTDITPRNMLEFYRKKSPQRLNKQAAMFNELPAKEKFELLFYMLSHNAIGLNQLTAALNVDKDVNPKTEDELIEVLNEAEKEKPN